MLTWLVFCLHSTTEGGPLRMGKFFGASAKPIDASATYFYTLGLKRRTLAHYSTPAAGHLIITPFHCLWSNTKRRARCTIIYSYINTSRRMAPLDLVGDLWRWENVHSDCLVQCDVPIEGCLCKTHGGKPRRFSPKTKANISINKPFQ